MALEVGFDVQQQQTQLAPLLTDAYPAGSTHFGAGKANFTNVLISNSLIL